MEGCERQDRTGGGGRLDEALFATSCVHLWEPGLIGREAGWLAGRWSLVGNDLSGTMENSRAWRQHSMDVVVYSLFQLHPGDFCVGYNSFAKSGQHLLGAGGATSQLTVVPCCRFEPARLQWRNHHVFLLLGHSSPSTYRRAILPTALPASHALCTPFLGIS